MLQFIKYLLHKCNDPGLILSTHVLKEKERKAEHGNLCLLPQQQDIAAGRSLELAI